ncbi:MAG: GAF domain-containing protein [Gammaproteobacteria bacterium]|nr:GAF domain-containing protein [Gammaproteobacteria bacterium]
MNDYDQILTETVEKFSANAGMIHKIDPSDNCLHIVAYTKGLPQSLIEATSIIPIGKGISGTTALTKKPIAIKNLSAETPGFVRPAAKTLGLGGMLSAPIFKGDEVIGTIGIATVNEREFTEEEIKDLVKIANDLANKL